ncbi:MAG: metallophosphoesterase family protein [Bacteroidales bacterium]|jgi:putative phosphoesterase|nr:metallophosphoesterase family protein [Bacteroidales bacterium]
MKRIGLLSDTHGFLDEEYFDFFKAVDEIWHAGDIGTNETADRLQAFKPLRAVFGNIDDHIIRSRFPEQQKFEIEGMKILMTHIGGYPGRYAPSVKQEIFKNPPDIFISGHSHILKVMPDKHLKILHINPGAAGNRGIHKVKTVLRFVLNNNKISDLEILEKSRK